MSRVVVSEFVTLDGVFEDPGGVEGSRHGGWAFRYERGPEGDRYKLDEILEADALLLGRVTYEGFAQAWPGRTDDVGFADKMNTIPKYVASTTLTRATWHNSTILPGPLAEDVRRLARHGDGTLLVVGSGSVVRHLIRHDLVDEIRLMIFPTALGRGVTLFGGLDHPAGFGVGDVRPLGATVLVTLRREQPAAPANTSHDSNPQEEAR